LQVWSPASGGCGEPKLVFTSAVNRLAGGGMEKELPVRISAGNPLKNTIVDGMAGAD
jgi:hypothetical protein